MIENLDHRSDFIERYELATAVLDSELDYRIVGSLATAAYIDPDAENLDFNRYGAVTDSQRVPDIDILVPRDQLQAARACRELIGKEGISIKLGLAAASSTIDYRPDQDESFLTHRSITTPVASKLFAPVTKELVGANVVTVDPNTLLHTYVTFGGTLRPKDIAPSSQLASLIREDVTVSEYKEAEYASFHDFIKQRSARYPIEMKMRNIAERTLASMPAGMRGKALSYASPVAALLKQR